MSVLRPLDTLIAHKMINLSSELSTSQKRIAAAIVDHYNRKTTQCDPSLDSIAWLLGIDRRTVIRAMSRLERTGMFRKQRHGGRSHRNSYEPIWMRFRELDEQWKARRAAKPARSGEKMSPLQGQAGHVAGGEPVTQTCLNNQSRGTCLDRAPVAKLTPPAAPTASKRWPRKEEWRSRGPAMAVNLRTVPSRLASHEAAERRWSTDLNELYAETPLIYAQIIEAIDTAIQTAATEAELHRRGAGIEHILRELRLPNPEPSKSDGSFQRGGKSGGASPRIVASQTPKKLG